MPTHKAKEIDNLLTGLNRISRQDAEERRICTVCKEPINGFRDELSVKEARISGMCQSCQDKAFAPLGDEE